MITAVQDSTDPTHEHTKSALDWPQLLRQNGLRITSPRLMVLDALGRLGHARGAPRRHGRPLRLRNRDLLLSVNPTS